MTWGKFKEEHKLKTHFRMARQSYYIEKNWRKEGITHTHHNFGGMDTGLKIQSIHGFYTFLTL